MVMQVCLKTRQYICSVNNSIIIIIFNIRYQFDGLCSILEQFNVAVCGIGDLAYRIFKVGPRPTLWNFFLDM